MTPENQVSPRIHTTYYNYNLFPTTRSNKAANVGAADTACPDAEDTVIQDT